ncbi:MAG: hypothetical protein Q4D53_08425, partial [Leptotrichiaceae bacterium]|nr:hypothetical protein [Leptotrichiaceae bacterium]
VNLVFTDTKNDFDLESDISFRNNFNDKINNEEYYGETGNPIFKNEEDITEDIVSNINFGNDINDKVNKKENEEHPAIVEIKKFMNLLIIGNYKELKKLINEDNFELTEIMLSGTKKMKYRINGIKYNNEKAIINITIKQPNLDIVNHKVAENFEKEEAGYDVLTNEEKIELIKRIFYKTIQNELENNNLEYFQETLDLTYIKIGKSWILKTENKDEFFNIFMSKLKQ